MSSIYSDIAKRSGGNIYIGVVGPVRTGKSTFIHRFMETAVIPNIKSDFAKERATDELPQSSGGKTIMTTEPKFIPEEAVEVNLDDNAAIRMRMIDCVGYVIPSAVGYFDNEAPRMVKTPWFEDEIPFNMAAEIGTQKVITEHSTIGLVVTTDGSITDLPRDEYEACEEQVINELKEIGKPFIVLLNSVSPETKECEELCKSLSQKYGCCVMPVNCLKLNESDIKAILSQILYSFPIKEINFNMPKWVTKLDKGHWLKENILSCIKDSAEQTQMIRDVEKMTKCISANEYVISSNILSLDFSTGTAVISVALDENLFYKIIGEKTNLDVSNESDLMGIILELSKTKSAYEKFASALSEVEATGYGIVMPTMEELRLDEPEMVKSNGKYGVKLKASAPTIHMIKAQISTEISPIVGSEEQSSDLVSYMLGDFENNPEKLWDSNIFGKSLYELVNEGLHTKIIRLGSDAREKLGEAVERIVNEGCNGLICFIL